MTRGVLGVLLFVATVACAEEPRPTFCDGYQQGYRDGFCMGHPAWAKCPEHPPSCQERQQSTYEEGRKEGYRDGMKEHGCGHSPCAGQ